jgi:hypothetical protein
MNAPPALHGLNCPRCGGVIPLQEGQIIVCCPYCDLRSYIRGERGLLRYQVATRVGREQAAGAMQRFLKEHWAIARDAAGRARLSESFLAFLPFWAVWGRALAWIFGEKQVGSGDNRRYEPREVQLVEEVAWNGAACDVGELGVNEVPLNIQGLEPYDPETMHAAGLVFEPVGSFAEARRTAEAEFEQRVRKKSNLDRISQVFLRFFGSRAGMVYYPLWVLRYIYRGRTFQVVVDGVSGKVLYGKAPGNTFYRAAVLVLGMAIGAFLAFDVTLFALYLFSDDSDLGGLAIAAFIGGLALMYWAYRRFRYGEEFEYRPGKKGLPADMLDAKNIRAGLKEMQKWNSP